MTRFTFWAVALGLAACGGKYEELAQGVAGGGAVSDPTSSASGGSYSNPDLPKHDLGTCTPGFDPVTNPGLPCPWITEAGQCFATDDAACACACPTDHDSVCYSGFGSDNAPTLVHCS
jgi:hypothetical protein